MAETTKTLQEHSAEEQNALPYAELCRLRRAAFRAHVAAMELSDVIAAWAQAMVQKTGAKRARAHFNVVSWPVALMIARYGESIEHWPNAFSADDIQRAREWLTDAKYTGGIEPLTPSALAQHLQRETPLHGLDEKEG